VNADAVHLDLSLGSISLEEFSAVELFNMKKSSKARVQILKILPNLRKSALNILQMYGITVFAFGKQSIPVRIAELTSEAHAICYAAEEAIRKNTKLRLGLPTKCQTKVMENRIELQSFMATENEVVRYVKCDREVIGSSKIVEMFNHCVRGFKMLEIVPL